MCILNLTQHPLTSEQVNADCVDVPVAQEGLLKDLLTFDKKPSKTQVWARAKDIVDIALSQGVSKAMIGGAPYLMPYLHQLLLEAGIEPLYAFSVRESQEQPQPDGSVRKVNVFRFDGFV